MRPLLALSLLAALGCAHLTGKGGSVDDAQRQATLFLRTMRWQGPRDTAPMLVPEQRDVYLGRIDRDKLEQSLKVTEFELREVERSPDGSQATARADLTWYLEPDVSVKKEGITLHLAWRGSIWLVDAIDGGPLALPAIPAGPAPAPAQTDAGASGA